MILFHIVYHIIHFAVIAGPPFKPIIHKDKSRVTAVSVILAWEAKFDGGYPQTLSVLYGVKGGSLGVLKTGIKDPGLGNVVHTQFLNLTGVTCYQFQITSKNHYNGTSISNSDIIELCTKGMVIVIVFMTYLFKMPNFVFIKIYTFIAEKVTLQSKSFLVEIKSTQAVLSWSKPTGSFSKQVIEKWKYAKRVKREVMSACIIAGNCEEEVIPIEQTSHTTDIEPDKEYKFILVLYDGDVKVAQFEPNDVIEKGK